VRANLRGHDSHGAIRIPQYAGAIRTGHVNPKSLITVIAETPVIARLDGGRGFGQVVARRGMRWPSRRPRRTGSRNEGFSLSPSEINDQPIHSPLGSHS
jgi:uncharacterized oxidoreductase